MPRWPWASPREKHYRVSLQIPFSIPFALFLSSSSFRFRLPFSSSLFLPSRCGLLFKVFPINANVPKIQLVARIIFIVFQTISLLPISFYRRTNDQEFWILQNLITASKLTLNSRFPLPNKKISTSLASTQSRTTGEPLANKKENFFQTRNDPHTKTWVYFQKNTSAAESFWWETRVPVPLGFHWHPFIVVHSVVLEREGDWDTWSMESEVPSCRNRGGTLTTTMMERAIPLTRYNLRFWAWI